MPDETKDEIVQVPLRIPRGLLEAVKEETCVEMNSTAIVAFIRKHLKDED